MAAALQFAFGPFRLDARTSQLWRDATEVKLTPRATSVLHLLAQRAEQVVTKQELFNVVWGGMAVTDDALSSCIQERASSSKIQSSASGGSSPTLEEAP
jgi:DNA-binding winged helix-turn-helix (wHTH) protein